MSKITITIEDYEGQVAVNVQVEGWDKQSSAVNLAERALEHMDSLAQVVEPPRMVHTAGEINAKRKWAIPKESVIIHAH